MHIKDWINRISKSQELLGGYSVCPYAKNAQYEIVNTNGRNITAPTGDFELVIYVLPDDYSQIKVEEIAQEYNLLYKELVFLPDPKDRYTEINGVQTNNGKQNLILCQPRAKLTEARERLAKTEYYSYWDENYLQEILDT